MGLTNFCCKKQGVVGGDGGGGVVLEAVKFFEVKKEGPDFFFFFMMPLNSRSWSDSVKILDLFDMVIITFLFRDRSQPPPTPFVRGGGGLKIFNPCKGEGEGPEKKY